MSYSRRQLYALGEPLGDSATYRKADGGLVLGDGGGGGCAGRLGFAGVVAGRDVDKAAD